MEFDRVVSLLYGHQVLISRKAELALELSRNELAIHKRHDPNHGVFDPDYSVPGQTVRQRHVELQNEYAEVCERIAELEREIKPAIALPAGV